MKTDDKNILIASFLAEGVWVLVSPLTGSFLRQPGHMTYLRFPSKEEAEAEALRKGYKVG